MSHACSPVGEGRRARRRTYVDERLGTNKFLSGAT